MSREDPAVETAPGVLIVEDEAELADIFAGFLDGACRVRVAYTGDEALELIDHDIDVALLDRKLGDWTGDELVTVIRERQIDCGIVMVTAVEPDVDIVDLPVDDYVTKPVFEEDIQESVEEVLFRQIGGTDRRELLALVSRKIVLEEMMDRDRLEEQMEYRKLERRIAIADERLDVEAVEDPDEDRPEACPGCDLRWDVRVDGTVGYLQIGDLTWKCRGCGNVANLQAPEDRPIVGQ